MGRRKALAHEALTFVAEAALSARHLVQACAPLKWISATCLRSYKKQKLPKGPRRCVTEVSLVFRCAAFLPASRRASLRPEGKCRGPGIALGMPHGCFIVYHYS